MAGKKETAIDVLQVTHGKLDFCILGSMPLILNRMSEKVMRELLMPKGKKTAADKASSLKHDPVQEFLDSPYIDEDDSAPTYLQHLSSAFKNALKGAALWNEVKDRLDELAVNLSGGQQQRLCIARGLATDPEIILFDEPTSALDPIATGSIEELIGEIKHQVTILIVTHNMQQAARVSDYTAYMYLGELMEYGETNDIFMKPKRKETEDYITGRFG